MATAFMKRTGTTARVVVPVCALLLATACTDRGDAPTTLEPPASAHDVVAAVQCEGSVSAGTVNCDAATPPAAALTASSPNGIRPNVGRTLGRQGVQVRLISSPASYSNSVYEFFVTLQNLSDLPLVNGARVFFATEPTVTSGSGAIKISNATGTDVFTQANQKYFAFPFLLGPLEPGEKAILQGPWKFEVPASVKTFSFLVYVSTQTEAEGPIGTIAPQVTSVGGSLVSGRSVTVSGTDFSTTPGNNKVYFGSVSARVTSASATSMTVIVPCLLSGNVQVQAEKSATRTINGSPTSVSLRGAGPTRGVEGAHERTLEVGRAVIVSKAEEAGCNALMPSQETSRYVVAVYNVSTNFSPPATKYRFSGSTAPAPASSAPAPFRAAGTRDRPARTWPAQPVIVGGRGAGEPRSAAVVRERADHVALGNGLEAEGRPQAVVSPPPPTKTIRVPKLMPPDCVTTTSVAATLVPYAAGGKLAIYEDNGIPSSLKAANNVDVAITYQLLYQDYNTLMEPVLKDNFGDPLHRDHDNNGVIILLVTRPEVAARFGTTRGFVVPCDATPAGNFGEYMYARIAVNETVQTWEHYLRLVLVHEAAHVTRYAYGPTSIGWLEEGMGRMAEELFGRRRFGGDWGTKNSGFGTGVSGGDAYENRGYMYRHFLELNGFLRDPNINSVFNHDAAYGPGWSLLRYAIDHYGYGSESAVLKSLNQASTPNLTQRLGTDMDELMGGWALALYVDDYPGRATPIRTDTPIEFPRWNLRSIYSGLHASGITDFAGFQFPLVPVEQLAPGFGSFGSLTEVSESIGGSVAYRVFQGNHTLVQLLSVEPDDVDATSTLRIAIARLQ